MQYVDYLNGFYDDVYCQMSGIPIYKLLSLSDIK